MAEVAEGEAVHLIAPYYSIPRYAGPWRRAAPKAQDGCGAAAISEFCQWRIYLLRRFRRCEADSSPGLWPSPLLQGGTCLSVYSIGENTVSMQALGEGPRQRRRMDAVKPQYLSSANGVFTCFADSAAARWIHPPAFGRPPSPRGNLLIVIFNRRKYPSAWGFMVITLSPEATGSQSAGLSLSAIAKTSCHLVHGRMFLFMRLLNYLSPSFLSYM